MELLFLGRGAAFNPKEGNTSAFFIDNKELFLIDCGESVFERLIGNDLLSNINTINLMITHTHSDHIGSIGTLAMYSYYKLHKPLNIILPDEAKHIVNIQGILDYFGCDRDMYNYIGEKSFDNKYSSFNSVRYVETDHRDGLNCYSLIFETNNGLLYYSGDTREENTLKAILDSGEVIDKLYVDTTTDNFPGNVHLYIGKLNELIPKDLKNKVYCMHINNDNCIVQAKEYGFNVVEVYNKRQKDYVKKKTTFN